MPDRQAGPASRPVAPGPAATAAPVISTPQASAGSDPPLQEVLVELWQNVEKLMRQEVALARTELEAKADALKADAIAAGAGTVLALASVLTLVATVILLLSQVMVPWLAALITSLVTGGAGYALLKKGKPSAADFTPERSMKSVKKDLQTFREAGR